MPKFNVEKTICIDSPIDTVYPMINDFNNWIPWSPWLLMEPEAKVEVANDSKFYSWDGDRVGSGNMSVLSEDQVGENKVVKYDLNFLKPWKSQADVSFVLTPLSDTQTQVSWTMDSSLPLFLFWMKKMMITFIGMDYQRGLNMLKELVETGSINSKIEMQGESHFPGTLYIGIESQCAFDDIGPAMSRDFTALESFMENHTALINGKSFSIYHKWNMSKQIASYTAAIPVSEIPDNLPDNMIHAKRPDTKVFTLRHTGAYMHLGNAWSTLYTMERNKEIACKKGQYPFEVYENNEADVAANELITDLKFPIK